MIELKPCPFCGGIPNCGVEFYESRGAEVRLAAVVECTGCGIRKREIFKATDNVAFVPFCDYEKAFTKVINAWNARAKMDVPDTNVGKMEVEYD